MVSTGYMAICSVIPAKAPAYMCWAVLRVVSSSTQKTGAWGKSVGVGEGAGGEGDGGSDGVVRRRGEADGEVGCLVFRGAGAGLAGLGAGVSASMPALIARLAVLGVWVMCGARCGQVAARRSGSRKLFGVVGNLEGSVDLPMPIPRIGRSD